MIQALSTELIDAGDGFAPGLVLEIPANGCGQPGFETVLAVEVQLALRERVVDGVAPIMARATSTVATVLVLQVIRLIDQVRLARFRAVMI